MSQFLPESFNLSPSASPLTPANAQATDSDIALMQRVLSAAAQRPNMIPDTFMAYVIDYIQANNLTIPISQVVGFTQSQKLLDNKAFTAPVSITATTEATANTIVTSNTITFDGGTPAEIEFYAPSFDVGTANVLTIVFYEDSTSGGKVASVASRTRKANGAGPAGATNYTGGALKVTRLLF